jgi:hypothetical protein
MPSKLSDYASRRAQEILLVLVALETLKGIRTKQEILRYIRSQNWLARTDQDNGKYEGSNESKSDTLLCFGRKDAVLEELMFRHDEKDSWEITRIGCDTLKYEKGLFVNGIQKIERCYMWTEKFKKFFDPLYTPSKRDWTVPEPGQMNGGHLNLARKYTY